MKEFHASKQSIALNLVNINQVLLSEKFEHSDKSFKYFISYKDDANIRPWFAPSITVLLIETCPLRVSIEKYIKSRSSQIP